MVEGTIGVLPTVGFTEIDLEDTVAMKFLSESGGVYALQCTTDLVRSSAWSGVGPVLTGSGTHMFFFDPREPAGSSTSKTYRVVIP